MATITFPEDYESYSQLVVDDVMTIVNIANAIHLVVIEPTEATTINILSANSTFGHIFIFGNVNAGINVVTLDAPGAEKIGITETVVLLNDNFKEISAFNGNYYILSER